MFFRRPDLFAGVIAMSGCYDIKQYAGDYYDDNCYFNSPVDYLPNLTDETDPPAPQGEASRVSPFGSGRLRVAGAYCGTCTDPQREGITHHFELWGHDVPHDWPAWRAMLPHIIDRIGNADPLMLDAR